MRAVWSPDDLVKYSQLLANLKTEFQENFQALSSMDSELEIFASPFSVNAEDAPVYLQLELIDLQSDRELVDKFKTRKSLPDFYENFPRHRFPRLHRLAAKALCMFGSTFLCEHLFSKMKQRKPAQCSTLTNTQLRADLRVNSARTLVPNIERLVQGHLLPKPKAQKARKK